VGRGQSSVGVSAAAGGVGVQQTSPTRRHRTASPAGAMTTRAGMASGCAARRDGAAESPLVRGRPDDVDVVDRPRPGDDQLSVGRGEVRVLRQGVLHELGAGAAGLAEVRGERPLDEPLDGGQPRAAGA
jgi:hypothetical protein